MILEVVKSIDLDAANCNKSTNLNDSSIPCLSVQHEIDIAKCFQLIVGFGLLPSLLPNIGIPIQRRSKYYHFFHQSPHITDEQVLCKIIAFNPVESWQLFSLEIFKANSGSQRFV